ncbi:hypothetical protein CMUS01_02152 [Colletotrichum musicola]|uniref:Uncharacterized protein n=1 Tax=Colletotrichum musicola TaxID=2175873 RepID=A0A8H6NVU5_9PEZI|nr:hypothetical protein CMUS01_02152 [Colletotrichum musicola]
MEERGGLGGDSPSAESPGCSGKRGPGMERWSGGKEQAVAGEAARQPARRWVRLGDASIAEFVEHVGGMQASAGLPFQVDAEEVSFLFLFLLLFLVSVLVLVLLESTTG